MKPIEQMKHTETDRGISVKKKTFKDLYKMEIFGVKNERKRLRFVDRSGNGSVVWLCTVQCLQVLFRLAKLQRLAAGAGHHRNRLF